MLFKHSYQPYAGLQDDVHGGSLNVSRQRLHVDSLGCVQAHGARRRLQPAAEHGADISGQNPRTPWARTVLTSGL